jgi:hypothetical protein
MSVVPEPAWPRLNTWTVRLSVFAPVRVVRLMIEAAERVPANGATLRPDASVPADVDATGTPTYWMSGAASPDIRYSFAVCGPGGAPPWEGSPATPRRNPVGNYAVRTTPKGYRLASVDWS